MAGIGILIFPDVEELDFVGPFEVLSYVNKVVPASLDIKIVAASLEPVRCFNGLRVLPDVTIADCPSLDILIIPGGFGRKAASKDRKVLQFVRQQNKTTTYRLNELSITGQILTKYK